MGTSKSAAISAALVLGLCHGAASASVITISPTKKESVFFRVSDQTNSSTTDLYAGNIVQENIGSSTGFWRFFESFDLPDQEAGNTLTSAILSLTIRNSSNNRGLGVFGTAGWTTPFDWFHQPAKQSSVLGRLSTEFGTHVAEIDITDYLKSLTPGPASVGFEVRSLFEGSIGNDLGIILGQSLSLSFAPAAPDPHALPEPDGGITFTIGLATLVAGAYFRRKKACAAASSTTSTLRAGLV